MTTQYNFSVYTELGAKRLIKFLVERMSCINPSVPVNVSDMWRFTIEHHHEWLKKELYDGSSKES